MRCAVDHFFWAQAPLNHLLILEIIIARIYRAIMATKNQAAQQQHYVPQMLLRGFLSKIGDEANKEQVRVFDLERKKSFPTSIANIMGERRFNEWWVDEETLATIEPATAHIESHISPLIEKIRAEKRLEISEATASQLAVLMAFQLIRTKKMRQLPEQLDQQLINQVRNMGLDPARLDGIGNWDEAALKKQHAFNQITNLPEFTKIMVDKIFFVMTAPEGKSFYLGDNPVVLHSNAERNVNRRGLGIGVPYVQIYLPLSHDVLLCAYDRAVLGQLQGLRDEGFKKTAGEALVAVMEGQITTEQMRSFVENSQESDVTGPFIDAINAGEAVACSDKHVDQYNSLQVRQAHRFIVDPLGKFDVVIEMLAKREASKK
jgi:hypothetical protein